MRGQGFFTPARPARRSLVVVTNIGQSGQHRHHVKHDPNKVKRPELLALRALDRASV